MTQSFRFEIDRLTQQGHKEAAFRLIDAQLQQGGLTPAQLGLAAFLGHEIARQVVGYRTPALETSAGVSRLTRNTAWVNSLLRRCQEFEATQAGPEHGKRYILRACAAACRLAVDALRQQEPADAKAWEVFLTALECWLASPSRAGQLTASGTIPIGFHHNEADTITRAQFILISTATAFQLTAVTEHEVHVLTQAMHLDVESTKRAIADALIPWCLNVHPQGAGRSASSFGRTGDEENGALM